MKWVLAFHIISVIAWFAGLFYLPRLFVYHAQTSDELGKERFKVMEHKLYFYIMSPAGLLTTIFGFWVMSFHLNHYLQQTWLHIKLTLVLILWIYHLYCGQIIKKFKNDNNKHSHVFYRYYNEIPTVLLIFIVILAVVKPFTS